MVLVVDGYTANLPWEMLQAEDLPMVLKTAVVRQFASTRYRKTPRSTTRKTACVIANRIPPAIAAACSARPRTTRTPPGPPATARQRRRRGPGGAPAARGRTL